MLTVIDKAKMFREIVNEMADLYEKKNANYGDSFSQLFDALGPISGLVPLHNKLDRATSLIKGNKNNFESLEDTFKDLACYAIMNLIEMKSRATTTGEQGELTTIGEPIIIPGIDDPNSLISLKNPCNGCPWNNQLWIGGSYPYAGDSPCQWCEHGTKVTCKNINNYTSIAVDDTDNIKLKATSSNGLEDAFVKANPSIVASTMIDECHDLDDLTIDEMLRAEREEGSIWSNIYTKFMTRRGNK